VLVVIFGVVALGDPISATSGFGVSHTGLEPQASRQGPRQVCYSRVRALGLTLG